MKRQIWSLGILWAAVWTLSAQAEPPQLKEVPADAAWLAHVDVDAMQNSPVIEKFYNECNVAGKLDKIFDLFAKKTGTDPRKDLRAVTLYGTEIAPGNGVLIVRGKLNKELLQEKAKKAPGYETAKHGDHDICTWTCPKRGEPHKVAATFYKDDVLVLASGADMLGKALDTLDGKSDALEGTDSPLAAEIPAGTIFLARATGINESPAAGKNPVCPHLKSLDYAKGQNEGQWFGRLTVTAADEESAQRIEAVLNGLKAMIWLHAESVPSVRELLDKGETTREGSVVRCHFQAPVEQVVEAVPAVCEMIRKCAEKHKAMHGKKFGDKRHGKFEKPSTERDGKKARPERPEEGADAEPQEGETP